ncbi:MAG TPA: response regulator [Nitrososphaeraceae archaeon]|nr:response regulator [Nitrososphaeraceae archaeon]
MKYDASHLQHRQNEKRKLQERIGKQSPFIKRILIVDNDPDIILTFKKVFEEANRISGNKISFQVNTYNNPFLALSEFKPNFYDLMLIDINMPEMNGFDFCVKALKIDANPRVCFMSSGLINQEALREQYPTLSIGCFIKKPVTMENLIRRVKAELE